MSTILCMWAHFDTHKCLVQDKAGVRHRQLEGGGDTNRGRPPQASILTHHPHIVMEHCFNDNVYSSIGVWCMCAISGATQNGTNGWEVNAMYRMCCRKQG